MKKMLLVATMLFAFSVMSQLALADTTFIYGKGGATWYDGQWTRCPLPGDELCAIVIKDSMGNVTTGIFGWPGGSRVGRRFTYCPNPGPDICAIVLEGPNPGGPSTHAFYGKGGARRDNNGTWTYCPQPAQTICAIVQIGPPGAPIQTTIYGAGGIRIYPTYTEYCPLEGDQVCANVTEYDGPPPPPPGDTIAVTRPIEEGIQTPDITAPDFKAMRQNAEQARDAMPGTVPGKRDLE